MLGRNTPFLLGLLLAVGMSHAQTYPIASKPVRLVVPFSAGSGTDVIARILAEDLSKSMGAAFVVDNKPGANGSIAAELVSKAPADGHTLLLGTSSAHSANQWLFKRLSYQPISDFTPIARAINIPFLLAVHAASPIQNVDQLVDKGKTAAGISMAHGNATGQVAGKHLMASARFQATEVPYRSTPPALVDLAAGRVDSMFVDIASSQNFVKDGRVRPIAVMADKPTRLLPGLPALGARYPGFTFIGWAGLLGPAGMPDATVQRLNAEVQRTLAKPEIADRFIALGLEPYPSSPSEFLAFMREQEKVWGQRIKDAGIQPE